MKQVQKAKCSCTAAAVGLAGGLYRWSFRVLWAYAQEKPVGLTQDQRFKPDTCHLQRAQEGLYRFGMKSMRGLCDVKRRLGIGLRRVKNNSTVAA